MKIVKWLFENLEDAGSIIVVLLILAGIILALALLNGIIGYFLLSVAFPEYITFGWYWWRFLALGLIIMFA